MKKEEEKQFNQLFNNEEHCEELNIIRYNVLKFIDENYISKVEVLEEIEKKILELGIQTDKADTQIQNEDFNEFFSKEDAEKLIHDNLIIIKALEDIIKKL